MPSDDSTKRVSTLLTVVVCFLIATATVWPKVALWNRHRLASHLTLEIKAASDSQVRIPLRQLASLGNTALRPLVEATTSQRAVVAALAQQILKEQFDSWLLQASMSRRFDVATPATTLADALASHIDQYGPRGKQWAESLALGLIVLAEEVPAHMASEMLENCSHILAAVPASGPRLRNLPSTISKASSSSSPLPRLPSIPLSTFAVPSEKVIDVPAISANDRRPQATTLPVDSSTVFSKPRTRGDSVPSGRSRWSADWGAKTERDRSTESLASVPVQPLVPQLPPKRSTASHRRIVDIPSPAEMEQQMNRLRQKSSPDLVRLLPRRDLFDAGPIRAVLWERGLSDVELNMANQYSSTQVGDRLQLIDDLSFVPASTAKRWLHWLLEDASAEVRFRAFSALATTADPKLFELARRIATNDSDPRVVKLATRIMREAR